MKKTIILLMLGINIFLSCDNVDSKNISSKSDESSQQRTSTIFNYVESTHIENGLVSNCENNILIFPSMESFEITIDKLDEQIDNHCDEFEQNADSNLTDEEFELLSETSSFDEDMPLRKFQDDLKFCSLWNKLYDEESLWLSQQGDGDWNEVQDPDNHYIDDESERVLLNIGSEVMIGNRVDGYVIYKFYEWGFIKVLNDDIQSLVQINTSGVIPTNNPNIVVVDDTKLENQTVTCKKNVTHRKYFSTGSKTRIKTVDKTVDFKGEPQGWKSSKIKSKTKYYRKKLGVWTRGKTTITAGFEGTYKRLSFFQDYRECGQPRELRLSKTRKRSKVKIKHVGPADIYFRVEDDFLRGVHKRREDVIKKVDYFNGDVI